MRLIVIGTEYTGKTALIDKIQAWSQDNLGIHHHLDDHFSIPDQQMLKSEEHQKIMTGLPGVLKERFQRFQIAYHVRLINKYEHILLGGFHIEEVVYGPRYYYPEIGHIAEAPRAWEADMPTDSIVCLLTAQPDVIKRRMKDDPHEYPVVPESDIEECQAEFQREFGQSWFKRKLQIDTSDLAPAQLLTQFLGDVVPHLSERDLAIRSAKAK